MPQFYVCLLNEQIFLFVPWSFHIAHILPLAFTNLRYYFISWFVSIIKICDLNLFVHFLNLLLLLLSHVSHVRLCATPKWQPTRLPCPWDSPDKNTGVGCHFLLQCKKGKVKVKSLSHVHLLATPRTAAYQAPPFMGFSRRECLHFLLIFLSIKYAIIHPSTSLI